MKYKTGLQSLLISIFTSFIFIFAITSEVFASPTTTTSTTSGVDGYSTQITATVNPNSVSTTAFFLWDTVNNTCQNLRYYTAPQSIGSGSTGVAMNLSISGFIPGVTYYYCIVAYNTSGISYGTVNSFIQPVNSSCSQVPTTGSFTMPSSCLFANPIADGVDSGTGTFNTGILTIPKGQSLTVSSGQMLGYGVLYRPGATVVINSGGSLRRGPIWVKDTDGDGYPDNTGTYGQKVSVNSPGPGYVRRSSAIGSNPIDCAPNDPTKYRVAPSYIDADGDGFTTANFQQPACIGASPVVASSGIDCDDTNPGPCQATGGSAVAASQTSMNVSGWSPNTTNGPAPTSYDVYYCIGSSCSPGIFLRNIATTSTTHTSLSCGTTYGYSVIARNASGSGPASAPFYGTTNVCVTAPSITAQGASSITNNSVTLTSTVNGNNGATNITYRYSTSNLSCSSLGTTLAGTNTNFTGLVSDSKSTGAVLSPNQTYYYCATADNTAAGGGTTNGVSNNNTASSFLTLPGAPTAVSGSATSQTAATVTWTNPSGGATSYDIWRCTGTGCSSFAQISTSQTSGASDSTLSCGTTYRYRIRANNATGPTDSASSADVTTNACVTAPSITAQNTTSITSNSVTFTSTVNGNSGATNITYRYSTANFSCNALGSTLAGTNTNFTGLVSDSKSTGAVLSPNTTYYYCATADNTAAGGGTTNGVSNNNLTSSFTTLTTAPSITAQSSTVVASTVVYLSSTVNGNNSSTNITYRYGTSNVACNLLPSTLAANGGNSNFTGTVSDTSTLSSLTGNTTYYYCATANNIAGTTNGVSNGNANSSFTTSPVGPTINSESTDTLSSTGVTLHSSVDGGGSPTTLRYYVLAGTSQPNCNAIISSSGSYISATNQNFTGVVNDATVISGLNASTTYQYCARATNAVNGSVWNGFDTFTTSCNSLTWYRDADGDGYGSASGGTQSSCTQPVGYVSNNSDCMDSNSNVHPGAGFYTVNRGDGSFDYDCDGVETKNSTYNCVTSNTAQACSAYDANIGYSGYVSSVPACGQTGTYLQAVSWDSNPCSGPWTACVSTCNYSCYNYYNMSTDQFNVASTTMTMSCQ